MWGSGVLVEVLGVDGQSFWNEMMRSRKSEEIRSDVEIVQCIWSPKRKGEKEKWWKQAQEKVCGGVLDWMLLKLIFASVCVCVHTYMHMCEHTQPQTSQSLFCTEGSVKPLLCLIKTPHLWATVSMNPASYAHHLLIWLFYSTLHLHPPFLCLSLSLSVFTDIFNPSFKL